MMANEINISLVSSGFTDLVARIYLANWVQQGGDITMTEIGGSTGRYTGSAPASTLATKEYEVLFYQTTPTPDTLVGAGKLLWDVSGDAERKPSEILSEVWQDQGLNPDDPKIITEVSKGVDYNEDSTGIHKDVIKAGSVTTVTRVQ